VQEVQHSTVRISKAASVSANSQSAAFDNKTFQSWIKLKGFDESLQMNVFTLHAEGGMLCLLCSKSVVFKPWPPRPSGVARQAIFIGKKT